MRLVMCEEGLPGPTHAPTWDHRRHDVTAQDERPFRDPLLYLLSRSLALSCVKLLWPSEDRRASLFSQDAKT